MKRLPKLGPRSLHLLECVAAGQDRVFAADTHPPGFSQAERRGLLTRVPGSDRAELTEAGRAFLAGRPDRK